jgi:hypothetical protein
MGFVSAQKQMSMWSWSGRYAHGYGTDCAAEKGHWKRGDYSFWTPVELGALFLAWVCAAAIGYGTEKY